jgi:hypothetical protein
MRAEDGRIVGEDRARHGFVVSARDAEHPRDEPLQPAPEPHPVEDGIEKVGEHAVVRVFPQHVVAVVMRRGLDEVQPLQQPHDRAVLPAGAMAPLVHLVGIEPQHHGQGNHPVEHPECQRQGGEAGADGQQQP